MSIWTVSVEDDKPYLRKDNWCPQTLTPSQARKIAAALIKAADHCEGRPEFRKVIIPGD